MSSKPPKKFIPLTHEDLELKRELLQAARDMKQKGGFENVLASALIYSSFAEYLAENLLDNLMHFIHSGSYAQYAGIIFIEDQANNKNKKTLGQYVHELEKYSFPDKSGVINCLKKITEARNNFSHKLAKADTDDLGKIINHDLVMIQNETEDLVSKIDTIYAGLNKILNKAESSEADKPKESA